MLESVSFMNLRSYDSLSYTFSSSLVVLVGQNGVGKTNFLEALSLLGTTRSFRTTTHWDVVKWGEDVAACSCVYRSSVDEKEHRLGLLIDKKKKKRVFRVDKQTVSVLDFLGRLPVVLFAPDDVLVVTGSPSLRRKYLDLLLSQLSSEYFRTLAEYQRVLRHRNTLLSGVRDQLSSEDELEYWDQQLVSLGSLLVYDRIVVLREFHETLSEQYSLLADTSSHCLLNYKPTIQVDTALVSVVTEIEEAFLSSLQRVRSREIRYGRTVIGPHLDDIEMYLDDRLASSTASRGEVRTLMLSLQLSQRELFLKRIGVSPLMLFDDVFSELDVGRRERLLAGLSSSQAVFTATDIDGISSLPSQASVVNVVDGQLQV